MIAGASGRTVSENDAWPPAVPAASVSETVNREDPGLGGDALDHAAVAQQQASGQRRAVRQLPRVGRRAALGHDGAP